MKIAIIDDEKKAGNMLQIILKESYLADQIEDIVLFSNAETGYLYIQTNCPDIVFLDIEMPGLSGIDLAGRLLDNPLENKPEIIFVTAYPQYSLNAWQLDASGYILKPYDEEQICHALERAICVHKNQKLIGHKNIQIFCFPGFDVFVNHSPINFKHEKSKELLALLTYYRGGWVNIDKMTFELFEEMEEKTAKNYIRTILFRLKQILQQEKIDYILESGYGKARVIPDTFYCDFYEYLNGKTELYHGEFMGEYTWAQNMGAHMWHKN